MGAITCRIPDDAEERIRKFIWKVFQGKGHHLGDFIALATSEFLDLHEDDEPEVIIQMIEKIKEEKENGNPTRD